jgi:hypothetical protein
MWSVRTPLLGAASWLFVGCVPLSPKTTVVATSSSIEKAVERAVVVLGWPGDRVVGPVVLWPCLPYDPDRQRSLERGEASSWSVVRVFDEHGAVVVDLRRGQSAALSLDPGAHALVAVNWSNIGVVADTPEMLGESSLFPGARRRERRAGQIAYLEANLVAGRIYAARLVETVSRGPCASLELMRVDSSDMATFRAWFERSEHVSFLGEKRERGLIDGDAHGRALLRWGQWRKAHDARWDKGRSTLGEGSSDDLDVSRPALMPE